MIGADVFSKICDAEDFFSTDIIDACRVFGEVPNLQRKQWEYAFIIRNMDKLGALHDRADVLGLACETEPMMFYAATKARSVLATDLYSGSDNTTWTAGRTREDAVYERAPFPYPRERLRVKTMDMRRIEAPDESFDLVWSCSSIEHVDTIRDLEAIFREVGRVLRPNGIHVFTTEWKIGGGFSYFPNGFLFDRPLLERVTKGAPLEPIGPLDLSFSRHWLNTPVWRGLLRTVWDQIPNTVLFSRGVLGTSFVFAQRKSNRTGHAIDVINEDAEAYGWLLERHERLKREIASPAARTKLRIDGTLGSWLANARLRWADYRGD